MGDLRRLVLVRHGETDGESSVRFHGSSDVELSEQGRKQMRHIGSHFRHEGFDLVVASPLRRSWKAARLVVGDAPVLLEADFREIHFGRWEGLTRGEIEARDPVLHRDWQEGAEGFEFPGGEKRSEFRARVERGLERLLSAPARSALVVVHKGVTRAIYEKLTGETLGPEEPALAEAIELTRGADGKWFRGRRSSNPPGVDGSVIAA